MSAADTADCKVKHTLFFSVSYLFVFLIFSETYACLSWTGGTCRRQKNHIRHTNASFVSLLTLRLVRIRGTHTCITRGERSPVSLPQYCTPRWVHDKHMTMDRSTPNYTEERHVLLWSTSLSSRCIDKKGARTKTGLHSTKRFGISSTIAKYFKGWYSFFVGVTEYGNAAVLSRKIQWRQPGAQIDMLHGAWRVMTTLEQWSMLLFYFIESQLPSLWSLVRNCICFTAFPSNHLHD